VGLFRESLIVAQAKEELMSLMDKNNNSGVRGLADMDTRLSKLNKRIAEVEEAISKLERVKSVVTFSDCLWAKERNACLSF